MKVLILTQFFDPEPNAKGGLFARELVARGHEVEVLTGFPNYPGGKLYPGYKILPWMREQIGGIKVLRVPLYPNHNHNGLQRALNYVSFAISAAIVGTLLTKKADIMYVYHPPITAGLAAAVIGFVRRTPFVYDINDLWPDTVAASMMMSNRRALTLLERVCRFVYRCAQQIVVVTPGFKAVLAERGVALSKINLIYNWCDESVLQNSGSPAVELGNPGRFCILFAGTMGLAQGLESVLLAAQICRTTVPAADFVFIGGGVERSHLERMVAEMQLDNVRFLPRQPMDAMGGILAGADALLVHLKDDPLFRITIPSKTQAYLAVGKPILMAVCGDSADLVERSQSGILCEPGNPQSIADGVKELVNACPERLAAMGSGGSAFYDRELSVAVGVEKFSDVFNAAVNESRSNRNPQSGWRFWVKRTFDCCAAICAIVVLSPFYLVACILVRLGMGSPILFRQQRPGRFAEPFMVLKFRTMLERRDASGNVLPDADRLTRLGRFLRATSLDELPQLWNVVCGDLSLVGPRPLLMEYLSLYEPDQARRHDVMPGITGWAQINGRNALSWEEKFAFDQWYVENWSLQLDLKILWMTLWRVLKCDGITNAGHATMPQFPGHKDAD